MEKTIKPGKVVGSVTIPSSKSLLHRVIISAALSKNETTIYYYGFSDDIKATVNCLKSICADITVLQDRIIVKPIQKAITEKIVLNCNESGTTLRLLLPIIGALGINADFIMSGNLPNRPLSELTDELSKHGMCFEKKENILTVKGNLKCGNYNIKADVSSQFVSGLLFALALLDGESTLNLIGTPVSSGYIALTESTLELCGIEIIKENNNYRIKGNQVYECPSLTVESDWSNAAVFLCAGALSINGITVNGLDNNSKQGDRAILNILKNFGAEIIDGKGCITVKKGTLKAIETDASQIPDLIPVICVLGALSEGTTRITNADNLHFKESDRISEICRVMSALGADIKSDYSTITVKGKSKLQGGQAITVNDHRIAMAAALASLNCENSVIIKGAECINKSYPSFLDDFEKAEVLYE